MDTVVVTRQELRDMLRKIDLHIAAAEASRKDITKNIRQLKEQRDVVLAYLAQ